MGRFSRLNGRATGAWLQRNYGGLTGAGVATLLGGGGGCVW